MILKKLFSRVRVRAHYSNFYVFAFTTFTVFSAILYFSITYQ